MCLLLSQPVCRDESGGVLAMIDIGDPLVTGCELSLV